MKNFWTTYIIAQIVRWFWMFIFAGIFTYVGCLILDVDFHFRYVLITWLAKLFLDFKINIKINEKE